MKRGSFEHPKMLALGTTLKLPPYAADGVMDSLVQWAAKYAPAGDVGKWPDEIIARGIGWDREPGELLAALVSSGWLEEHDEHRYIIHDWSHHADDSVNRALARAGKLFADGSTPNTRRLNEAEKEEAERKLRNAKRGARRAHVGRTVGAPPRPVPSGPAPSLPVPSGPASDSAGGLPTDVGANGKSPGSVAWETGYAPAYEARYGVAPVRNAQTNSIMSRFVELVGADVAPGVAAYFVESPDAYFVKLGHDPKLLIANAGKLHTEYLTKRRITGTDARRNEETAANPFARMALEQRAKGVPH